MRQFTLHQGDMRDVLAELPPDSFHSIVCDPPYALVAGKKGGSGLASVNLDSPYGRARIGTGSGKGGFMGSRWDSELPQISHWQAALRVLKPGGYLVAFGGTRTYHRLVCAIEDAGFEIRDCLMWLYAQGFPKSLDVSKAIDAEAGAEREVIGQRRGQGSIPNDRGAWGLKPNTPVDVTLPATEAAKQWDGYGTALKPSWEPIVLARKPFQDTIAQNVQQHGAGALNIEGCRVPFANAADEAEAKEKNQHTEFESGPTENKVFGKFSKPRENYEATGRWPANVAHDGSPEVLEAMGKFGTRQPGGHPAMRSGLGSERTLPSTSQGTTGARIETEAGTIDRFFFCGKATREDREEGCDHPPKRALLWSAGEKNPGSFQAEGTDRSARNFHPTVKPTALMRWLCKLVTPAGGTILDPFMGSGSSGKAAMLEGFDFVGIDGEPEYIEIARARISHFQTLL